MRKQTGDATVGHGAADADRFRALYDAHVREVSAYCVRRVSVDRADDVVAETFLVAWQRLADVPDGDAGLLWLYRVAHRVVGREWRGSSRRKRLTLRLQALRPIGGSGPEDAVVADEDTRRVLSAAARLNSSDGEILRLVAWERLTAAEIATVLEITPNAVHQRVHRAKRNLVAQFDGRDEHRDGFAAVQKGSA